MKKIIILAVFSFFLLGFSNNAEAKGIPIPVSFGGEKISTVVDLPNDSTTFTDKGYYANIGCVYKQFSILWIPIWNWDEKYCISYEGTSDFFGGRITKEQAEDIAKEYNVKLLGASPSFWNKIGGKLIILTVLGLIIWGSVGKKDDEVAPTDDEVAPTDDNNA